MFPIMIRGYNAEELESRVEDLKKRGFKVVTPVTKIKQTSMNEKHQNVMYMAKLVKESDK